MSNLNSYPYTLNTHDNIEAGDIPLPNGILDLFYKKYLKKHIECIPLYRKHGVIIY